MSEKFEVLTPVVEQYALTVSIPMKMPLAIVRGQNICQAEYVLITKRNRVSDHARKVELDRARAVLKYAQCYNAVLNEMYNENYKLNITLGFSTIESLIDFRDTMGSAVSSATME